ncbi:MAG: hypothetical protein COW01_04040 [Bdellovibrionales bacterium CG12_big_fil_rev_8_21_14_0_65_38_15]|nr:MAG: hypothetical protein COW79_12895 [Bdellovibrionales bacterium CG22_combo_CG10-13_8_21_14_all_38_13]PIQ56634.1 MAG: hypothetical protein COW01_04040 [Bdellovibrionales bacterium CG12_big_fil_rev_8_21_14_0_65_38_15]PIR31249.1 MAG: hypothetical protein COV38_01450 [Bdellovibrionales bacterium CG11_big_fil_rev_8_21_14_0_20_38_13]
MFKVGITSLCLSVLLVTSINASTSGKLLLSGGVNQVEGSAGGGLTPWAFIGGYGTEDEIGANAFITNVKSSDYNMVSTGFVVGFYNRFEFSFAHQSFDTRDVGATLGLGQGYELKQNVFGAKVRLFGDGILEQGNLFPQISFGLQYKKHEQGRVVKSYGAKDDSGIDFYLNATKVILSESLLMNLTLRATKANQIGIMGFGGDRKNNYELMPEFSIGYLFTRKFIAGFEYRFKPNNLGVATEDDWLDVFGTYAFNKNFALTIAYAYLGNIVLKDKQSSLYTSLQVGF